MLPRLAALVPLLLLTLASPAGAAAQSPGELLDEVRRRRDTVDVSIFRRIARPADPEAFEALQEAVGMVRQPDLVRAGFGAFGRFRGVEELEGRAIAFLASSAESSYEPIRRGAARALASFGQAAGPELRRIVDRSRDEECRAYAIGPLIPGLVESGSVADLALVLDHVRIELSGGRAELLGLLRGFSAPEHLPVFVARIQDRRIPDLLRILLIEAIATRPEPAAGDALRGVLRDRSAAVQYAALEGLAERGERVPAADLRRLMRSEDGAVRRLAVLALARIQDDPEAWLRELRGLSEDRSPAVRMGAAAALGELRTPAAVERLLGMLGDPDRAVRTEVLQVVGNLRRKESIPALIGRAGAERGRLKQDVLAVLRLITGLDHGTTRARWMAWWDAEGAAFQVPSYEDALAAEQERAQRRAEGHTVTSFYGLQVVSDRVCFVLDVSGSMRAAVSGGKSRMQIAREELARVLETFPDGDLFNVIFFSTDVMAWQDRLVPMDEKSRASVLSYVKRQEAGGYTAVYDALEHAFEDERIDTIYLLTDGAPYRGTIDDPGEIRAQVRRWNTARHVRIHGVSIGTESALLRALSRDTGGDYRSIRD